MIRSLLLVALLVVAAGAARAGTTYVSPADLEERRKADESLVVLDVRTAAEYLAGHVPGAINIPHDELRGRLGELPTKEGGVVAVYCERGPRASRAQRTLAEAGYPEVLHLEGGYANWKRRGYPIEH